MKQGLKPHPPDFGFHKRAFSSKQLDFGLSAIAVVFSVLCLITSVTDPFLPHEHFLQILLIFSLKSFPLV